MTEPTRPRPSKAKAKPKASTKPKASPKKPAAPKAASPKPSSTPVAAPPPDPRPVWSPVQRIGPQDASVAPLPPVVAPPPQVPAAVPAPVPAAGYAAPASKSNGLAVASIVCAVAGFTFVPLVGGLLATILGALALKREREDPEHNAAGGMAVAGVAIGGFTGVLPLLFLTGFAAKNITPIPFVLTVAYAAFVFWTATRGRTTTGQKLAIIGGSVVTTALAIALTIGLAFGFYFLMRYVSIEIGRSIGDAFSHMFDGIGNAFGSCGDAFKF